MLKAKKEDVTADDPYAVFAQSGAVAAESCARDSGELDPPQFSPVRHLRYRGT